MRVKTCRSCQGNDPTVSYRPQVSTVLCAACHADAVAGSTVRQVRVPEREQHDRYAQLAVRYGVK